MDNRVELTQGSMVRALYPDMRWIAWWRDGRWTLGSEWPDSAQELVNSEGMVFDFIKADLEEYPWFRMGERDE